MFLRVFLNRLEAAARSRTLSGVVYAVFARLLPVRRNTVLMESHKGDILFGNPYYMLRHILSTDRFKELHFVVVCSGHGEASSRRAFGAARVSYCRPGSLYYAIRLATAEFLVNDVAFPVWFSRRPSQRYLNTWHGTPIKALGIAVASTAHSNLRNMQRNFLHATHILFPNDHTETVLHQCFGLRALWHGQAIRCGYPRNDVFIQRRSPLCQTETQVNVAYMPTWRGTHATLEDSAREHLREVTRFTEVFAARAPDSMVLWVKLHPLMRGRLDLSHLRNVSEFPSDCETYEHLASCGVLVTDYSSVMIDFAVGGGSVLLYVHDVQRYKQTQSFSIDLKCLPFPTHSSPDDVMHALCNQVHNWRGAQSNGLLSALIEREDGQSSRRVCDIYFGATSAAADRNGAVADQGNRLLLLIEEPLTPNTRPVLGSMIDAITAMGWSTVISTPGEAAEDPALVEIAKASGAAFCPTTSLGKLGSSLAYRILASPETRRLYASARFSCVVRVGPCPSYRGLISEFSAATRFDVSLAEPSSVAGLPDRIERLARTLARHQLPINAAAKN